VLAIEADIDVAGRRERVRVEDLSRGGAQLACDLGVAQSGRPSIAGLGGAEIDRLVAGQARAA